MESKSEFFIKYKPASNSAIDFSLLGESLIGYEELLRQLINNVAQIKGDVKVRAIKAREGSIIFDTSIIVSTGTEFFIHANHGLEFLKIVGGDAYSKFLELHRNLNQLAADYPVDYEIGKWLGQYLLIQICFSKYQKHKIQTKYDGREMPVESTKRLHGLVRKNKFKKIFTPFIEAENKIESIEFSDTAKFDKSIIINQENFENFLSEDKEILPELHNGDEVQLEGQIIGLQASRGDSMRFRLDDADQRHRDLVAYPPNGKGTENFRQFYKTRLVSVKARVLRSSQYQKPKIIILEVAPVQREII